MLEGLEANEQRLSDLGSTSRIDSEFFRKRFLVALDQASKANAQTLEDVSSGVIHPTEVERIYSEAGIQILLAQNVRDNIFDFSNEAFMPDAMRTVLATNLVQYDDVVLTRSGANYGQCACFKYRWPIYACADVLVIRPRNIAGGYLSTFFNSCYGKALLERGAYGAAQPHIAPPYLRSLPIPRFHKLEAEIDRVIQSSVDIVTSGRDTYTQAEALLLRTLGLEEWQSPEPLTYESTFAQAWGDGRLDAEHYQPKYAALLAHIKARGAFRLGDRVTEPIRRGMSPEYVEYGDVLVINSQHVGKVQVELDDTRKTAQTFLNARPNDKGDVRQYDVLLNSTGYITIGRSQCLLEDVSAVVDNHVAIIRPNAQVDPVYLACFLNTLPGQMQTEMNWTGSSGQIELRPDSVAE